MHAKFEFAATVPHGDLDRSGRWMLARLFKLLQEAAILHANEYGAGTQVTARDETWVLSRIAAEIIRYPVAGDALRVETWSTAIKGCKGFRDFRVYDTSGRLIVAASSLWFYLRLSTKTVLRVPRAIVDVFPVGTEPAWKPDLERVELEEPGTAASSTVVTLRNSDFDANDHVNNAAYFDLVETALVSSGVVAPPRAIVVRFAKPIALGTAAAQIRTESLAAVVRVSVEASGSVCAHGSVEL